MMESGPPTFVLDRVSRDVWEYDFFRSDQVVERVLGDEEVDDISFGLTVMLERDVTDLIG